MKLVFTKPHACEGSGKFPSFFIGNALKGYLAYRGVWIGEERSDFDISYNDFYHFYSIQLFHIPKNKNPAEHIGKAIEVFKSDGAVILSVDHTWNKEQIDGKRIWIKAQDN